VLSLMLFMVGCVVLNKDIANGLIFIAHSHLYNKLGILHRDISSKNILLNRTDAHKTTGLLIDFDYAEFLDFGDESPTPATESASGASGVSVPTNTHYQSIRTVSAEFLFYMIN